MPVLTEYPPTTTPRAESDAYPPVRLSVRPPGPAYGVLDGAWWPHSRDLTRELAALTDLLDPLWGRITRVTVNPTHWPVVPRKVQADGHVIKVGWFREQDQDQLMLRSYHIGRWDLLIIPPAATAAGAARLMAAACAARSTSSGSALLAAELDGRLPAPLPEPARADPPSRTQADAWEAEGGAMAARERTADGR